MKAAGKEYASAEDGIVIEVDSRRRDGDQMGMQQQRRGSEDHCSGNQQRPQGCAVPDLHVVEAPVSVREKVIIAAGEVNW